MKFKLGKILPIIESLTDYSLLKSKSDLMAGLLVGILIGTGEGLGQMRIGINLPKLLPFGWPSGADFSFALLVLVLPQIPMTLGNAVIANADLSIQYFPQDGRRVTYRGLCISMALGNLLSFFLGTTFQAL